MRLSQRCDRVIKCPDRCRESVSRKSYKMSKLEPYRPECFADKRQIAIGWRTFATQQELRDWSVGESTIVIEIERIGNRWTPWTPGASILHTVNVFTSQKQSYVGCGSEGWLL